MENAIPQAEEVDVERVPVEAPSTELAELVSEGDPDVMLAILEKKAELAPRFKHARDTILACQTYAKDWTVFDGKACLSSAGAERVGTLFDIKFFEVVDRKDKFTDSIGEGYRYVYQGKAAMGNRVTFAQGIYSTRDKFLGFKSDKFRPIEEINERDIMQAAYHIFKGNAVKELLGLRGIPEDEFKKIMGRAGHDAGKAGSYQHGRGTQGGTTVDDTAKQKELCELCIRLAGAGKFVGRDAKGKWQAVFGEEYLQMDNMELAKNICVKLSSFIGKDKKEIPGKPASQLKGQRLGITLEQARVVVKEEFGNGH